jgi:hypothetical protein
LRPVAVSDAQFLQAEISLNNKKMAGKCADPCWVLLAAVAKLYTLRPSSGNI